jgi:tetratricopeptide (TPR) repeat protein
MVLRAALVTLLLLAAAPGSLARAQSAEVTGTETDAEARASFDVGRRAYEEGRFGDALRSFRHAYSLSQRPELLYNIGTCQDRLRRDEEALASFEAYLEAVPDAENRATVEARVEVLRDVVEGEQPTPEERELTASLEEAPTGEEEGRSVWWLGLVGGAVALVAVAVVLAITLPATKTDDPFPGDGRSLSALVSF